MAGDLKIVGDISMGNKERFSALSLAFAQASAAGKLTGETDSQNQRLILIAGEGEFKEIPEKGVGLYGFMEDHTQENLVRKIRSQYFAEGLKIRKLTLQMPDKINIDAAYE